MRRCIFDDIDGLKEEKRGRHDEQSGSLLNLVWVWAQSNMWNTRGELFKILRGHAQMTSVLTSQGDWR